VLRQPEVAVTTAIWWVLGLEGASSALDSLVARTPVEPGAGQWRQEVRGDDGGRTDLEYLWGEPLQTRVVVEAKLGHLLTPEQVSGYAGRFGEDGGLLVVLAPASRRSESWRVIDVCRETLRDAPVAFDVWTYDEVIAALEAALPDSADVAQLSGLVRAHDALDVAPLSAADLLEGNLARFEDVWRVVDGSSFGIGGTRWPSGADTTLARRRYVTIGTYAVGLAVGVGRRPEATAGESRPWAWIRLGGTDSFARVARRALSDLRPDSVTFDGTDSWLPLEIPTGVYGSDAVDQLRADLTGLVDELRVAMAEAIEQDMAALALDDRDSATAVLGMLPMASEDLLTTSNHRRDDIWTLLTEASRGFYDGKLWPMLSNDPDYELLRYLPIRPYGANLATCLGPRAATGHDGVPRRWAWLRVHQDTPHAAHAFAALDQVAPGRVEQDPHGRVVALEIPTGVGGPEMLVAIRQQILAAVTGVHRVLADSSRDDTAWSSSTGEHPTPRPRTVPVDGGGEVPWRVRR
jgi:hypothetical protein